MGGHRAELVEVIRKIRNRWRLKLALRGVVVVVAGSVIALLLSASGLEALRFSAGRDRRVPRRSSPSCSRPWPRSGSGGR